MQNYFLKKITNITVSADVLAEVKARGINISQSCDQFSRDLVRSKSEEQWQKEHAAFITAYNQSITDQGLPLDDWLTF
jgi:antitoxin CcdA